MGIHEALVLKIVLLSSGGVDSSLTMLMLRQRGHEVIPLHVNYGHLAEEREWKSCLAICNYLGVAQPIRIGISGLEHIPSGLTDDSLDIEKCAFLPTRNLLFVTLGAAYAYSISCRVIAIGILSNPIFPDQTMDFLQKAETCISSSLGVDMKILAPLMKLDKRDTLNLALKHGLPLKLTYYCHAGKEQPCGKCISCKERLAAEKLLTDARHNGKLRGP
jgi:7-cyano-7-deazaguanine synthase